MRVLTKWPLFSDHFIYRNQIAFSELTREYFSVKSSILLIRNSILDEVSSRMFLDLMQKKELVPKDTRSVFADQV